MTFMKRCLLIFLVFSFLLTGCACRKVEQGAATQLSERMAKNDGLPSGQIYRSDALAGEEGYFSSQMMSVMYGEEAETRCFPLLEDYAIYLSSRQLPYEIAVFRCYAKSDTDRIVKMCLMRIETMRVLLAGTPFRQSADAATVSVKGRCVTMCLVP